MGVLEKEFYSNLAANSQSSTCLCLWSVWIKGVHLLAWLGLFLNPSSHCDSVKERELLSTSLPQAKK